MRKKNSLLLSVICYLLFVIWSPLSPVYASYVLPYPSFMPGNRLYIFGKMIDQLEKIWNFGTIAGLKYSMNQADKTLVEGKTLFEYSQYALGVDAFFRSDELVQTLSPYIQKGIQEGKDMSIFRVLIASEMTKHKEVLIRMKDHIPQEIYWQDEKKEGLNIRLSDAIDTSIRIRTDIETELKKDSNSSL